MHARVYELLCLLPALTAAEAAGPAYVGAVVCKSCHAAIFELQDASHHAMSLRPPEEIAELSSGLPFTFRDRSTNGVLTLHREPQGNLELTASRDQEKARLRLLWAFGSGAKGITPVGQKDDGTWAESRLSWYRDRGSGGGFGLTTGASRQEPQTPGESLGRSLAERELSECFSCHTTGGLPQQARPARHEMGIRCERCHGPGSVHVNAMRQPSAAGGTHIIHPGRLEPFAQVEMCGACHGKPPRDDDFALLQRIEKDPNTVRFPSQRLVLSRCYNEASGGLKCTNCHDPHADVAAQSASRDSGCLGCHSGQSGARPKRCPRAAANCASCHMPKQRVMQFSQFTDHWIRVVR